MQKAAREQEQKMGTPKVCRVHFEDEMEEEMEDEGDFFKGEVSLDQKVQ